LPPRDIWRPVRIRLTVPGQPIRSWQPKRDGERNEALDIFVYPHAALHGLISMWLKLNEEV